MELNVKERLVLANMLPKESNFTTLKIMRKLREELSFNEEEHKALKFNSTADGRLMWDSSVNLIKDVPIGELMAELIAKDLKKLDKESKLTEDHFSLFEKFVEDEN
jgi:hypothetical protein